MVAPICQQRGSAHLFGSPSVKRGSVRLQGVFLLQIFFNVVAARLGAAFRFNTTLVFSTRQHPCLDKPLSVLYFLKTCFSERGSAHVFGSAFWLIQSALLNHRYICGLRSGFRLIVTCVYFQYGAAHMFWEVLFFLVEMRQRPCFGNRLLDERTF